MSKVLPTNRELLLPLIEGIHDSPPWREFLKHLVAQTHARRAFLIITLANSRGDQPPALVQVAAPRASTEPPLDFARFRRIGLNPYGSLRSGRVYSLEELLDYSHPDRAIEQRAVLEDMGARYGRFMRISAGGAADAWLLVVREREDFTGSAVATLSNIATPFAAALRTLAALIEVRLHLAMALDLARKQGVGQVAFDEMGRVMAADSKAEALLTLTPDSELPSRRRLQHVSAVQHAVERACADHEKRSNFSVAVELEADTGLWMLLTTADLPLAEPCLRPAAIGTLRLPRREDPANARRILSELYGLSINEASLAHRLSLGETIVEAGRSLNLTPETSRNYSKRIYAKTGARNQADLVRIILTGLVVYA